jgi:hypothetical protein
MDKDKDKPKPSAAASETENPGAAGQSTQPSPYGGGSDDGGNDRSSTHMPERKTTRFVDIADRQAQVVRRLRERKSLLELNKAKHGALTPEQEDELKEITLRLELADKGSAIDPLFKAVQAELKRTGQTVADHADGRFEGDLGAAELAAVSILGILQQKSQAETGFDTVVDVGPPAAGPPPPPKIGLRRVSESLIARFSKNFSIARGEFAAQQDLYRRVVRILDRESGENNEVQTVQLAGVVFALGNQGIRANDRYLDLKVVNALAALEGGRDDAPPSSIVIDLPDLDEQADVVIIADNLRAQQALFFAAMLEELKVFQVVEKLVQIFQHGMLPLGKGTGGDLLYGYWKKSINRINEIERRNMYARSFGIPGGEVMDDSLNTDFDPLFLRFVSAVSSFIRQFSIDELLRSKVPLTVSMQQVQKSAHDLGGNLSVRGYGIAYFAATELQTQIKDMFAILNEPEIRAAYGARDPFQLIDQVATLELGGARDSRRYRTMANAGAIIIGWLAERAGLLNSPGRIRVLDLDQIRDDAPRPVGTKVLAKPNDRDLVDACEQWLAVTGTSEERVMEYSQPSESPLLTTTPIRIPEAAREALESVVPAQSYRSGYTQ